MMADDRLIQAQAELQALMADILQEFQSGSEAREDLVLRDAIRATVWAYNNQVRDDLPRVSFDTDAPATLAALPDIDAAREHLRLLRERPALSIAWVAEANAAIGDMLERLRMLPPLAARPSGPTPSTGFSPVAEVKGGVPTPSTVANSWFSTEEARRGFNVQIVGNHIAQSTAGSGGGRND